MKGILSLVFLLVFVCEVNAQVTRLAILDFDNISGIAKYDGLGKAMSSMLISDIEANVSSKRLQLVERAQIQKVLKEQNFQASGSVNKNTAVQAGKLLGVNYLLIGDVYILNDELIINARLTNTETGDIVFSKKQEGKTVGWLTLKTNIAKDLASSLTQPFTVPTIPDKEIPMATITTFGNAILAKDIGDTALAGKLVETVQEFSPEFKYLDDLKLELNALKKQVAEQAMKIEILNKSGGLVINAKTYIECWNNLLSPLATDSSSVFYLEFIIDNFPQEALSNVNLYAYPLIWDEPKWLKFVNNKDLINYDVFRMNNHINKTKNKKIACIIYKKRIDMFTTWGAYMNDIGFLIDSEVQNSLNKLNEEIMKYI
jgi:TolB-like protein